MKPILFSLPGNENLAKNLCDLLKAETGDFTLRQFPDEETYIKIHNAVAGRNTILVCTLDHPDSKLLPLFFLAKTLKDLGATKVCLVAPYLAYMRQDKRFTTGEGVTSSYFAGLISSFVDELITIDPHLHRRSNLGEIYTIKTQVIHASALVSKWINSYIDNPVLVGPDSESAQWVEEVAQQSHSPFIVLEKIRSGDREVSVSAPAIEKYKDHTPVLVDDIISTGRTMVETIRQLQLLGMKPPVCIGVHGIFAGNAYAELLEAGAGKIITTNCIPHPSNAIDIVGLIESALL